MTIAVTGGSGKLARLVVEHVLRSAPPDRLVVTTRNPARLADLAARGVDVRRADFDDPSSLPGAFHGVERLLLVSTDGDTVPGLRVAQHRAAVEQAARAGVAHIVYTSLTRAEPATRSRWRRTTSPPRRPCGPAARRGRRCATTSTPTASPGCWGRRSPPAPTW